MQSWELVRSRFGFESGPPRAGLTELEFVGWLLSQMQGSEFGTTDNHPIKRLGRQWLVWLIIFV